MSAVDYENAKLVAGIFDEVQASHERAEAERQYRADCFDRLHDATGLTKKHIRSFAERRRKAAKANPDAEAERDEAHDALQAYLDIASDASRAGAGAREGGDETTEQSSVSSASEAGGPNGAGLAHTADPSPARNGGMGGAGGGDEAAAATPYDLGYAAFKAGQTGNSKPFQPATADAREWSEGWLAAQAETVQPVTLESVE